MKRLTAAWFRSATPDEMREERAWRQRALAAGTVDVNQMLDVSGEVRAIDRRLRELGERAW